MILVLGLLFTAGCVAVSARRLFCVVELTPFDHASLAAALRERRPRLPAEPLHALEVVLSEMPGADWEREAAAALGRHAAGCQALVGELMTELDARAQRWARAPRVCASLASSFGFLLATVALLGGLSELEGQTGGASAGFVMAGVFDALDVVAVGMVGVAFCLAIQRRARAAVTMRLAAADRFVDVLESLSVGEGSALAEQGARASVGPPQVKDAIPSPIVQVTTVASKGSL